MIVPRIVPVPRSANPTAIERLARAVASEPDTYADELARLAQPNVHFQLSAADEAALESYESASAEDYDIERFFRRGYVDSQRMS